MTKQSVDTLASRLDKSVATLVVSQSEDTRRFIGEALLTAAALYLLKRYADKFLEGAGFDDMAKKQGQKTAAFLEKLRRGKIAQPEIDAARDDLDEALSVARAASSNRAAHNAATEEIVTELAEAGALRMQARDEAAKVAAAFNEALTTISA